MPRITQDEINTGKHVRYFVQPGGPGPGNGVKYSGQEFAYMTIESADNPRLGGINSINVHDPRVVGRYRRVGRSLDAPDFPTATVLFYQHRNVLPRHLTTLQDCVANFYQVVGDCKDLTDFLTGWTSYVKIYSNGENDTGTEAGSSFDSDDALQDELSYIYDSIYNIGALGFGQEAATEVYSEIVDIVYGSRVQCGACGPADNGTGLVFALQKSSVASVGEAPKVIYTVNGNLAAPTWTELSINGSVSTDVPVAIDVAGQYLIVVYDDSAGGGYFYSEINSVTGVPGTFTKVSTGFVTGSEPTDIFVASAREVWFSGKSGYIYKAENILSGVSVVDAGDTTANDLNRIHGLEEVLVAVGESATVVYSRNRGQTWATTTTDPVVSGADALAVNGDYVWWVGGDNGDAFYTRDGGENWTNMNLPSTADSVQDIVFATDEVGYLSYATSDPTGTVLATWNGGRSWTSAAPRIQNLPVLDKASRLAVPLVPNYNIAANFLGVGGLAGDGSDGILLLASPALK